MAKKIFYVDDSNTMRMSMCATLEMAGYDVEFAADGQEALERLQAGLKPDLIITDVNMPRMNGLDLIRHAKAMPGLRFTPILTLTTEGQTDKREESRRLGASGWLVKPIAGPDLIRVIQRVVV